MARLLTDREIAENQKPGLHRAGETMGLWINVTKSGTRSWVFRYTPLNAEVRGSGTTAGRKKPRSMGLGRFPDIDLSSASEMAIKLRQLVAAGIDPLNQPPYPLQQQHQFLVGGASRQDKSFAEIVESYLATIVEATGYFRSDVHRRDWHRSLALYALPLLGHLPIERIDTNCILDVLQQPTSNRRGESGPLWTLKPVTASRLRGRLEAILSWAAFHGLRPAEGNPARWHDHLKLVLVSPERIRPVNHHSALPYKEVPQLISRLREVGGQAAAMLEFAILAACRSSEVRKAQWQEIDFDTRVWTIPPARMKTYQTHRVPLTNRMSEILVGLPRLNNSPHVFVGTSPGGYLAEGAMRRTLHRLEYQVTPHGFRSSFRDWAAENGVDWFAAELALSHQVGSKTSRAYHRSDLLEARRKIMMQWEWFCDSHST